MTRAPPRTAAEMERTMLAVRSGVPIESSGAPGKMPATPNALPRAPAIDATAVPWKSVTRASPITRTPARSGWVVSTALSMIAVSGAPVADGAESPGTRNPRQSVAARSSPPVGACCGASARSGSAKR